MIGSIILSALLTGSSVGVPPTNATEASSWCQAPNTLVLWQGDGVSGASCIHPPANPIPQPAPAPREVTIGYWDWEQNTYIVVPESQCPLIPMCGG